MSASRNAWSKAATRRKAMLKKLFARHDGRCAHCGCECVRYNSSVARPNTATVDHEPPRCELPYEEWFNPEYAVLSCFACNQAREQAMTRTKLGVPA